MNVFEVSRSDSFAYAKKKKKNQISYDKVVLFDTLDYLLVINRAGRSSKRGVNDFLLPTHLACFSICCVSCTLKLNEKKKLGSWIKLPFNIAAYCRSSYLKYNSEWANRWGETPQFHDELVEKLKCLTKRL